MTEFSSQKGKEKPITKNIPNNERNHIAQGGVELMEIHICADEIKGTFSWCSPFHHHHPQNLS